MYIVQIIDLQYQVNQYLGKNKRYALMNIK